MVAPDQLAGVVVSAGKMMKTVTVRLVRQKFQRQLKKNFNVSRNILVHDANSSVIQGDVISLTPERHARHVHHAVKAIIAPYGKPLEDRPPLLTMEQREQMVLEAKARKAQRRLDREIEAERLVHEAKQGSAKGAAVSASQGPEQPAVPVLSARQQKRLNHITRKTRETEDLAQFTGADVHQVETMRQ